MLQPSKGPYEGWNSAYSVESVLIQLQSFLFEVPGKRTAAGEIRADVNKVEVQSLSDWGNNIADHRDPYRISVEEANAYKCNQCKHRGPIEPYPPFHEKEADLSAFTLLRSPKDLLGDEFLCFHSRTRLSEASLGIGVSISRLPRTGEIRTVKGSLDLLCLRAFNKQKVRKAVSGESFTHWLPLYFGEFDKYVTKQQVFDEKEE